ncbi:MAG: DUF2786 domain-containing protein [Syntrophomonas sp.]
MNEIDPVILKIKKLLAKAQGNPFAEEAQAAILKAQELMAKNDLTTVDINQFVLEQQVVLVPVTEPARVFWWQKMLASIIAHNFRCYAFFAGRGRAIIEFLGKKLDVEIAKEVYLFALAHINYFSKLYIKRQSHVTGSTTGIKNDYIRGFLSGLVKGFEKQVLENTWGLVLVKDSAVDEAYNNIDFVKDRTPKILTAQDNAAIREGYIKGLAFKCPIGSLGE